MNSERGRVVDLQSCRNRFVNIKIFIFRTVKRIHQPCINAQKTMKNSFSNAKRTWPSIGHTRLSENKIQCENEKKNTRTYGEICMCHCRIVNLKLIVFSFRGKQTWMKKNRLRVKSAALKSKRLYISLSRKYAKESESDSHHWTFNLILWFILRYRYIIFTRLFRHRTRPRTMEYECEIATFQ